MEQVAGTLFQVTALVWAAAFGMCVLVLTDPLAPDEHRRIARKKAVTAAIAGGLCAVIAFQIEHLP